MRMFSQSCAAPPVDMSMSAAALLPTQLPRSAQQSSRHGDVQFPVSAPCVEAVSTTLSRGSRRQAAAAAEAAAAAAAAVTTGNAWQDEHEFKPELHSDPERSVMLDLDIERRVVAAERGENERLRGELRLLRKQRRWEKETAVADDPTAQTAAIESVGNTAPQWIQRPLSAALRRNDTAREFSLNQSTQLDKSTVSELVYLDGKREPLSPPPTVGKSSRRRRRSESCGADGGISPPGAPGSTAQRPGSSDSAAIQPGASRITVSGQRFGDPQFSLMGVYELLPGVTNDGRPVYKQVKGAVLSAFKTAGSVGATQHFLYHIGPPVDTWSIGDAAGSQRTHMFVASDAPTPSSIPLSARWMVMDDSSWAGARDIRIVQGDVGEGDGEEEEEVLDTVRSTYSEYGRHGLDIEGLLKMNTTKLRTLTGLEGDSDDFGQPEQHKICSPPDTATLDGVLSKLEMAQATAALETAEAIEVKAPGEMANAGSDWLQRTIA
jgi:hypothetical protein